MVNCVISETPTNLGLHPGDIEKLFLGTHAHARLLWTREFGLQQQSPSGQWLLRILIT
jgi:hypothetical protein